MTISKHRLRVLSTVVGAAMLVALVPTTAGAGSSQESETIKVGTTILNSPVLGFAGRLPGIKAAVRAINKRGGINGRMVDWILCEAADANEGEACARKMVDEGVVATINEANFAAEVAGNQILADAGIAQIDPFTNLEETRNAPNTFFLDGGTTGEFVGIPAYMKKKKLKTIQYLEGQIDSSANVTSRVDEAADHYGIEVKGHTPIPLAAADYTPYVADAADADADINITVIAPFQVSLLLQAGQQLGQEMRIGAVDGQITEEEYDTYGQPGDLLDGMILLGVVPPLSAQKQFPEIKRYKREMTAEFKAGTEDAEIDKSSSQSLRSWLAFQAFAKVAEGLDDVTAATVMEGFNSAKDLELGLIPPWTPSAQGPPGFTRASNPFSYVITVKDGKAVLAQKKPINTLIPFEE